MGEVVLADSKEPEFVNCCNKKRTEQIVSGNNNLFPRENLIFNRAASSYLFHYPWVACTRVAYLPTKTFLQTLLTSGPLLHDKNNDTAAAKSSILFRPNDWPPPRFTAESSYFTTTMVVTGSLVYLIFFFVFYFIFYQDLRGPVTENQ
jgi:hypothetical protein